MLIKIVFSWNDWKSKNLKLAAGILQEDDHKILFLFKIIQNTKAIDIFYFFLCCHLSWVLSFWLHGLI